MSECVQIRFRGTEKKKEKKRVLVLVHIYECADEVQGTEEKERK